MVPAGVWRTWALCYAHRNEDGATRLGRLIRGIRHKTPNDKGLQEAFAMALSRSDQLRRVTRMIRREMRRKPPSTEARCLPKVLTGRGSVARFKRLGDLVW